MPEVVEADVPQPRRTSMKPPRKSTSPGFSPMISASFVIIGQFKAMSNASLGPTDLERSMSDRAQCYHRLMTILSDKLSCSFA